MEIFYVSCEYRFRFEWSELVIWGKVGSEAVVDGGMGRGGFGRVFFW